MGSSEVPSSYRTIVLLSPPLSVQINWITRVPLLWVQIDWLRDHTAWMASMVDRLALSLRRAHQIPMILYTLPILISYRALTCPVRPFAIGACSAECAWYMAAFRKWFHTLSVAAIRTGLGQNHSTRLYE